MANVLGRLPRGLKVFGALSGANQASMLGSLLAMAVLARAAGADDFGRVVFAQACAAVAMVLLDIRFDDAVQRYLPIVENEGGADSAAALFRLLLIWDVVLGAVIVVSTTIVAYLGLLPDVGVADSEYLTLALLGAGVGTCIGTLNAAYAVRDELPRMAKINLYASLVNTIAAITGALLAGGSGFLIGQILGTATQLALLLLPLRRFIIRGLRAKAYVPGGLWSFVWKSSLAGSFALGTESGIIALAGVMFGPSFVGTLKIAVAAPRAIAGVLSPVSVQAYPLMAKLAAAGDHGGIRKTANAFVRAVLPAGGFIIVFSVFSMDWIVRTVYGEAYADATAPSIVLVFGAVARACVSWAKVLPLALGRPGLRLIVLGLESAATLGALVAVHLGQLDRPLMGYALLSCLISFIVSTFWYVFANRLQRPAVGSETR